MLAVFMISYWSIGNDNVSVALIGIRGSGTPLLWGWVGVLMGKKKLQKNPVLPTLTLRMRIAGWCTTTCIVAFSLWQGSYFPVQLLLMLAMLMLAFVLFGETLVITKEIVLLFAIVLIYGISLAVFSDGKYAGLIETLRTLAFPLALIVFHKTDPDRAEKAFFIALMSIAVLGLLAFASIIYIPGGVIESSNRLQSVIQYANTTALLMLIGILYSARNYISTKKIKFLCFGAVFFGALLLTGSRTTLVVAFASCFTYAFILVGRRGKIIAICSLAAAIGLALCLSFITDFRLLRISLYEPTLVERLITYQDAFGMLRGDWLFGIGVGNWQELQFIHQSAPYNVKYIHNFYMQMMLDGGIIAPLLLCAAVFPAIFKGLRSKSVHAAILIAVMLQAFLDFDMIFGAVGLITMFSLSRLSGGGKTLKIGKIRFAMLAPLLAVSVLWGSELSSSVADASLESGDLESAMSGYSTALALNPHNASLYYMMAQSTRDIELTEGHIRTAISKNPRDLRSISVLALIESRNGNYDAALRLCETLIENRRFSEEYQSLYIEIAEQAANLEVISDLEYEGILARIETISRDVNPLYTLYILN